jgi:hypothetical protein
VALRATAALVDFVRAILDFGGAFFAGARFVFAGARFTGAALRFDAALLAPARFDRVVALGFAVFFVEAFLAATRLDFAGAFLTGAPFARTGFLTGFLPAAGRRLTPGAGPLAVAARTSAPPDAGAATGAAADGPSPSQNLISARSGPSALR